MNAWLTTIGVGLVIGLAVGRFLPAFVVKKVHGFFAWAKSDPWFRNPAKPKRIKWLLATAELLEDEIPEPGQGKALYALLGAKISGALPILSGTSGKWASALEKAGDALDTELDDEIKQLAADIAPPPAV